jgi:hypothetical protein
MWTRLACWIHRIAANKLEQSGTRIWMPTPLQWRLVGGAMGGWAHCNGWNGINGTHMWFSYVWYHSIHFIPAITMSPSSYSSSHQPPLRFNVDPTFIPLWSTFFWCCVWSCYPFPQKCGCRYNGPDSSGHLISCFGSSLLRHFMLVFPLFWQLPVCTCDKM